MEKIIQLLRLHEGVRLKPYRCSAGKLTIGVGRNLEDLGITDSEADQLLLNDLSRCQQELSRALPAFHQLDEVRQAVLLNMNFNLGFSRFSQFKNMLAAVHHEQFETAATEMLDSRWARQVGNRATQLARMMATGQWPEDL